MWEYDLWIFLRSRHTRVYCHGLTWLVAKNNLEEPLCTRHDRHILQPSRDSAHLEEKCRACRIHLLRPLYHTIQNTFLTDNIQQHTICEYKFWTPSISFHENTSIWHPIISIPTSRLSDTHRTSTAWMLHYVTQHQRDRSIFLQLLINTQSTNTSYSAGWKSLCLVLSRHLSGATTFNRPYAFQTYAKHATAQHTLEARLFR